MQDDLQEIFANLLMKHVPDPKNGDGKTISIIEALGRKLLKDALSGSPKDTLYVLKLIIGLEIPEVAAERWDKRLAVMLNEEALWTPQMEEQFQAIEAKFAEEQDGGEFELDEEDQADDCDQTEQSSSPGW